MFTRGLNEHISGGLLKPRGFTRAHLVRVSNNPEDSTLSLTDQWGSHNSGARLAQTLGYLQCVVLCKPRVRFGLSSSTSVLAWKRFLVKPDFTVEKGPIPAFLPL